MAWTGPRAGRNSAAAASVAAATTSSAGRVAHSSVICRRDGSYDGAACSGTSQWVWRAVDYDFEAHELRVS
jgi:hypothetical protein